MTCPDSPVPMPRPAGCGPRRRARGLTLVEILVALGIAGILAAVAYPTYQSQVLRTRQATAQEALGQAALQLEKRSLADGRYPSSFTVSQATDLFSYSYSATTDGSDYLLTATGRTGRSASGLWAGVNSRNTRCTCKGCSAPSGLTSTSTSCPSGSVAY